MNYLYSPTFFSADYMNKETYNKGMFTVNMMASYQGNIGSFFNRLRRRLILFHISQIIILLKLKDSLL